MVKYHAKSLDNFNKKQKADKQAKRSLIGIEKFVTKKQRIEDMLLASKSNQLIAETLLSLWVSKSLRPFSIVEDEGFVDLVEYVISLQRRIDLLSRKTIRKNVMNLAEEVSNRMNKVIKEKVCHYVLTTSRIMDSFMAVTIHALTEDFDMIDFTLEVLPLTARHTSENIKDYFQQIFLARDLKKENLVLMLRDNASNSKKACELFDIDDFGCIGHSFHLITGPFLVTKKNERNDDDEQDVVADRDEEDTLLIMMLKMFKRLWMDLMYQLRMPLMNSHQLLLLSGKL